MDISEIVVRQAVANGGSITSGEMQAIGVSRTWIMRRVDEGWLVRNGYSSYFLPGATSLWRANLAAACHRLGAIVSHESAAQLHGMTGMKRGLMIVTVAVRRSNRFPGVTVRQKTDLSIDQTTSRDGLPTTTVPRTIIDLAEHLGPRRLARLVDSTVSSGLTSYGSIQTLFDALARRGKPGTRVLRSVMAERSDEMVPPESDLESRLLELIENSSLPAPSRQFEASWLAHTNGRVDLAYVEEHLVIEADGRRWHTMADAFLTDRERDNRAQLAGWRVLRFTWFDVESRPDHVVAMIATALTDQGSGDILV